jgi:hypothetical protein
MQGMIDIYEIRHRNVRLLVIQLEKDAGKSGERPGGLAMLATKLSKSSAQVAHFASDKPTKRMGDQIAREIEVAFGLEYAWMDWPQWDESAMPSHSQSVRLDPETLKHTIIGIRKRDRNYSLDDMLGDPAKFIEAYELLEGMIPKPVPDNVSARGVHADKTPQGATKDGRSDNVPVRGTAKRKVGSGRRLKT